MTIRADKLTAEVMLSAPRRSGGTANPAGKKVLYTLSTYSFEEHKKTSHFRVLDIPSGESTILYEDNAFSSPTWIGDDEFLFLKSGDKGTTALLLGRVSQPGAAPVEIAAFDGGLSTLKSLRLADGAIAVALVGLVDPSGKLVNTETQAEQKKAQTHSSARIYDQLYVRHWDAYVTENTQAIFYGRLEPTSSKPYALTGGLTNLLAGTELESPVPPFGGEGDFDLSPHGIAFVARDPAYNGALYTVSSVYFVPLKTYAESRPLAAPRAIATGSLSGYSAGPVFSPDGRSLAFTRMKDAQYESDKPRLLLLPDVDALGTGAVTAATGKSESDSDVLEFYGTADGVGAWDSRPDSITWSADGAELFVTAEYRGRDALYRLPSDPAKATTRGQPQMLAGVSGEKGAETEEAKESKAVGFKHLRSQGSVVSVQLLGAPNPDGSSVLFLGMSSLIDSSFYAVLDLGKPQLQSELQSELPSELPSPQIVSSLSRQGSTYGLSRSQVGEIWFKGAGDYDVHALVMRPSDFDAPQNKGRKYPLAFLIHGGPQGAWNDRWNTRWNPAVFAEQGYIVVTPNPTGSTGYGMDLENGIQNQWGGRPYEDLVHCLDHVAETMPFVDMSRAVALGASYGGYMINWIQGHPLGRRFKALVCHDGVFSTLNQYSSEELFFPLHDFGGTLWENRKGYERWDPARHTGNWATPMLVIHNELDYRLPVTEGLSMFNVLQSRNVPSRFLSFPDENHWVLKPENSLVWHREVLGWINKYAGVSSEDDLAKVSSQLEI